MTEASSGPSTTRSAASFWILLRPAIGLGWFGAVWVALMVESFWRGLIAFQPLLEGVGGIVRIFTDQPGKLRGGQDARALLATTQRRMAVAVSIAIGVNGVVMQQRLETIGLIRGLADRGEEGAAEIQQDAEGQQDETALRHIGQVRIDFLRHVRLGRSGGRVV